MIQFQERSFVSDKSFRPRPFVHFNRDLGLVFIATVWGKTFSMEDLVARIESYFISSQSDDELTSPFQPISSYNKIQNCVRIAVLMINDFLLKEINKSEYHSGIEIFLGLHNDQQFHFTTFGQPHLLMSRPERPILPIRLDLDHSLDMSEGELRPALPSHLLGINSRIDLEVQSLTTFENDQILLLSKSWIPDTLVQFKKDERQFEDYTRILAKDDEQPYWLGLLTFIK